ncbi:MAG TPA: T9SS type A sorting domain-containing protein, partial [Tenuifilaceae bacterium]|nr:T9SS type A sorting domain-containing protein [Tenuifilaceae bacterium]HOF91396.1 T9SS type A sorting domain-containing protein [Tenuifilaceae bacterium]HOM85491.1 T9SS type A sorting domain-containing protein [Tenuifilaceae bacterium]HOQ34930.1 T9SS type A sorting domain-containing protein [Tenuifilaceae bacterium]HOU63635.1 T9SS type A sorting domain-containing protein [Tenuifilaceae bacterium]
PVGVPKVNPTDTQPLRIYPNPTNDTVEVTIPAGATKGTLSVATPSGHIVHSQAVMANGEITLSAARWPTGLLIVSLTTPDRVFTTKLIKN